MYCMWPLRTCPPRRAYRHFSSYITEKNYITFFHGQRGALSRVKPYEMGDPAPSIESRLIIEKIGNVNIYRFFASYSIRKLAKTRYPREQVVNSIHNSMAFST